MKDLTSQLSDIGHESISEIFNQLIIDSPNFAARADSAHMFLKSLTDVLDGLSYMGLERFINSTEELQRASLIIVQAEIIKQDLYICDGVVTIKATKIKS